MITAIKDPGILLKMYGAMIRTARLTAPTISASILIVEIVFNNSYGISLLSRSVLPHPDRSQSEEIFQLSDNDCNSNSGSESGRDRIME